MKKTFLEPEEYCYPSGSLRKSRRRFGALCPDGMVRIGVCGIPDTYFSIPARLSARGRTVTGYVLAGEGEELRFIPYVDGKNKNVFLLPSIRDRTVIVIHENGDPYGSGYVGSEYKNRHAAEEGKGFYRGDLGAMSRAAWRRFCRKHGYVLRIDY